MKFTIALCGLPIRIHTQYPYTFEMCRDYLLPDAPPVETVRTTQVEIDQEIARASALSLPREQHEFYLVGRKLQHCLRQRGCLLVHGLALSVGGVGYLLLGKSGAGKTTLGSHCALALQHCHIVNGDKPFLRCQEDAPVAYGTPWNGKEGFGANDSVALAYLVFVRQGAKNHCRALSAEEAAIRMLQQVSIPPDAADVRRVFAMLDQLMRHTSAVEFACVNDASAAADLVRACRPER